MTDAESQTAASTESAQATVIQARREMKDSCRRGPCANRIAHADWRHVLRTKKHEHYEGQNKLIWAVKHVLTEENPWLNLREANEFFYLVFHVLTDEYLSKYKSLPTGKPDQSLEEQQEEQKRLALLRKRVALTQTADAIIKPGTTPDASESLGKRLEDFGEEEQRNLETAVTATQELIERIGLDPEISVRATASLKRIFLEPIGIGTAAAPATGSNVPE